MEGRRRSSKTRPNSLRPDGVRAMGSCLAKAAELLDFAMGTIVMGLQHSGTEDDHNDASIRELDASFRTVP